MRQSFIWFTLCAILLVVCLPAHAQKQALIPRIGILRAGMPSPDGSPDVFLQGLRDLGYIENKNIVIEMRYAEGNRDRLREYAKEMVRLKVDAIFTSSSPAVFALKQETNAIPIVIVSSTDPVQYGIVASLARPGGNITGLSLIHI